MVYPIGSQDFRSLRKRGAAYVDKTRHICALPAAGVYFFLSRPRRFGKSLTVSTLHELYSNSRDLFDGLWAAEHWDFEAKQRPVIWIKFGSSGFQLEHLSQTLQVLISKEATRLGVDVAADDNYGRRFGTLIKAVAETHPSGKCVVLVDEYDKPIVEYLGTPERAIESRDVLRPFYGALKDAEPYLEFVFITGVSAFSKVSLFSDLNNLRNLTLDPLAYTIVGMTQEELEDNFGTQIDATGHTREEVRHWYNGYSWGGPKVYNPWSVIHFLSSGILDNYWADSGTPFFLTEVMARGGDYELEGTVATKAQLLSFALDKLRPSAILWQAGYLTLAEPTPQRGRYTLRYPNEEVRQTFTEDLLVSFGFGRETTQDAHRLERALLERDIGAIGEEIDGVLAGVPHELWQGASERFYHAVVLTAFRYIGNFEVHAEVSSARGRADVVIALGSFVYAIEFKLLRPTAAQLTDEAARAAAAEALADEAIAQIERQKYLAAYRGGEREPVALAVVFDAERRETAVVREG